MAASAVARRWLQSKIGPILTTAGWVWTPPGGVPTPRFTRGIAPAGMPYPLVHITYRSPGNDEHVIDGSHVRTDGLWLVRAATSGSSTAAIEPIVDAIHAAIHWKGGAADGGRVIDCRRERVYDPDPMLEDGKFYATLGADYRISVQEV